MANSASPCRFMLVHTSHLSQAWRFEAVVSYAHRRVQNPPPCPLFRREACLGSPPAAVEPVVKAGMELERGDRDAFTLQSGA